MITSSNSDIEMTSLGMTFTSFEINMTIMKEAFLIKKKRARIQQPLKGISWILPNIALRPYFLAAISSTRAACAPASMISRFLGMSLGFLAKVTRKAFP